MNDKRIRQLVIAVLLVILALGLLSLISSLFQMIVPLAIVAAGVFAFYKVVLEGRDKKEAMTDEIAESAGLKVDAATSSEDAKEDIEDVVGRRLSAVQQAEQEYFEKSTPVEEIVDQIKARKQRLQRSDDL